MKNSDKNKSDCNLHKINSIMLSKSRFCYLVIFFLNLIDTDLVEGKGGGRGGGRGGSRGG